jgi:alpha-L-fucosidase 2
MYHIYICFIRETDRSGENPDLADAVRKSLEARTDIGTGWSLAWKINFWARLHDGTRLINC